MLKIENADVCGWEHAIRGMRNPMNSWEKSDSLPCDILNELTEKNYKSRCAGCKNEFVGRPNCHIIGENDHDLMMRLRNAGTDHRKFMRMIVVYVDLIGPLYWWKEFDTYWEDDFPQFEEKDGESLFWTPIDILKHTISGLNFYRQRYLETKDKKYWWQMIQLLPSSYNQKRTVMLNYEVLANIYKNRRNHKLDEWHTFCDWIERLPYSELITGPNEKKE